MFFWKSFKNLFSKVFFPQKGGFEQFFFRDVFRSGGLEVLLMDFFVFICIWKVFF